MSDLDTSTPVESAPKHLWEYGHPYYCTEGNFFVAPVGGREVHTELESWAEFKDTLWYGGDRDLNLLFRWDWHAWHLEYPEDHTDGEEKHVLQLYFILQRKAYNVSVYIDVTPADEPEVRAWLADCAKTIRSTWDPIIVAEVES